MSSELPLHRLNIELDLQSLKFIWAPVYSCTHWLKPRNSPLLPHLGEGAILVSQDRRHLFVSPWVSPVLHPPTGCRKNLRNCTVQNVQGGFRYEISTTGGPRVPLNVFIVKIAAWDHLKREGFSQLVKRFNRSKQKLPLGFLHKRTT